MIFEWKCSSKHQNLNQSISANEPGVGVNGLLAVLVDLTLPAELGDLLLSADCGGFEALDVGVFTSVSRNGWTASSISSSY